MTRRRGRWGRSALVVVATLLTACTPGELAIPDGPQATTAALPAPPTASAAPQGTATVAYPAPPSRLVPLGGDEPAADDLAMVWGLPLLRVGPDGHLRRGLVGDWQVRGRTGDGWVVDLHLRDGRWADGSPVTARDVVATLRQHVDRHPERFADLDAVEAPTDARVRLVFARPHHGWSDLLLEARTVVPAGEADGLADLGPQQLPTTGGRFRLVAHEAGRRMVFAAHPDGPLGPPALERLVVLFTPSYETALGLLDDGTVDVVLGHLGLNPVARARDLDGVDADAPLGGTTVALEFREGGGLGGAQAAAERRGLLDALDVDELVEGLLGPQGQVATSPWPGVPAPPGTESGQVPAGRALTLVHPQGDEALGFTARALQRDLRAQEVSLDLVPEPRPDLEEVAREGHDLSLQVHRTGPRPSLVPWVSDPAVGRAARAAGTGTSTGRDGLGAVADEARLGPLYRIGVAHAWRGVTGIRPSSWLGAGFWNVGEWARSP